MLPWIQKLTDSIPSDWKPELLCTKPRERVIGQIPADALKMFRAAAYARHTASREAKAHEALHESDEKTKESCLDMRLRCIDLKKRSEILMLAVSQEIRDQFDLGIDAEIRVRAEGVVLLEGPSLGDLVELMVVLEADRSGARDADGDEGYFSFTRSHQPRDQ